MGKYAPEDRLARRDDPEGPSGAAARPRVIVWGAKEPRRGLLRRLVDQWRHTPEQRASEVLPEVFRPPVTRRSADGVESPPDRTPELALPAADSWDPPDLTVDPGPTEEATGSGRPREGDGEGGPDHGPGPLYRATLQLLPGRLRPLDPDVIREEIRFVRPRGREAVVTLGWAEGEPPDHVTLNHPSVQDRHARMSFVDSTWRIESLVAGHPVRVNGEAVPAGDGVVELQSGDEVRLGEARFNFILP